VWALGEGSRGFKEGSGENQVGGPAVAGVHKDAGTQLDRRSLLLPVLQRTCFGVGIRIDPRLCSYRPPCWIRSWPRYVVMLPRPEDPTFNLIIHHRSLVVDVGRWRTGILTETEWPRQLPPIPTQLLPSRRSSGRRSCLRGYESRHHRPPKSSTNSFCVGAARLRSRRSCSTISRPRMRSSSNPPPK
jgi:hypothetical protein